MPQVVKVVDPQSAGRKKSNSPAAWQFLRHNKLVIFLGLMAVLLFFLGLVGLFVLSFEQSDNRVQIIPAETQRATDSGVYVDLSGAVERPGLYHLPGDARVNDLLTAAGGLSAAADRDWFAKSINLAQKLTDGIKIYIPAQNNKSQTTDYQPNEGETAGAYVGKVNINLAGQTELESLPEIGPSTAQKIMAYRTDNGPFAQIEDIQNVPGIGEKTYAAIKDLISVY